MKEFVPKTQQLELTGRDLEIMKLKEHKGLTNKEVAKIVGVSETTVKRTRQKESYQKLATESLETNGYAIQKYVEDLIALSKATKTVIQNGIAIEVPDNTARAQAAKLVGNIFGTEAPKDAENTAGVAAMTDEEVAQILGRAVYEYEQSGTKGDGSARCSERLAGITKEKLPNAETTGDNIENQASISQNETEPGISAGGIKE